MPVVPIKQLGQLGVVTDIDPFDLPPNAFNFAVNARFANQKVSRSPVFRQVYETSVAEPRFITRYGITTESILVAHKNGTVRSFTGSTETDVTLAAYVPSTAETPYTAANLSNVLYLNREDRPPWYLGPASSAFLNLTATGWGATWRTKVIRGFNSTVVAFNTTESGTTYPNRVRWSNFALANTPPADWDETDPTSAAGINELAEMEGAITDAQALRNAMIVYSGQETWLMEASGLDSIYNFRRLFLGKGAINANCSVEIAGKHYVFGADDIWVHDGISFESIANGRVRQFIFSSINTAFSNRCFVTHNRNLNEVMFCYVSGDRGVSFSPSTREGCNRAAVFNYVDQTWSFVDLPFVYSATMATVANTTTWATAVGTWAADGGSWLDEEDGFKKVTIFCGGATGTLNDCFYAYDLYGTGSIANFAVTEDANPAMFLERVGIDLDQLEAFMELRGYKVVKSIYPQGRVPSDGEVMYFTFGGADYWDVGADYSAAQSFDGDEFYKLDFMAEGRVLSYTCSYDDYRDASLSSLDVDVVLTGRGP